MTNMHDSGKRQEFGSGAVRDTAEGKVRLDLISPFALERLGEWLRLGAEKYKERNWEAGLPISRCIASLWRHLLAYERGERAVKAEMEDEETDPVEDHLAAIFCNTMFIIHYEHEIAAGRLPASLQDMPFYEQQDVLERQPSAPTPVEETWHVLEQLKYFGQKSYEVFPTLYIAGPMRGKPNLNWKAFDDATIRLRQAGYNVVSPAHEDRLRGIKPTDFEGTTEVASCLLREIVHDDLTIVQGLRCEYGDGLATLDGWGKSRGATAEVRVARWLELPVKRVEEWLDNG